MADDLNGPVPYTLEDAAAYLRPRMSKDQLEGIIARLPGFQPGGVAAPVGTAPTGGRPVRVWDLGDLQELHAALRRWL